MNLFQQIKFCLIKIFVYIERMENIDAIKQYITSDIFLSRQINNMQLLSKAKKEGERERYII